MKTSNLQLDNYFIKAFSFSVNDEFEQNKDVKDSSSFNVKCNYSNIARKKYQRRCEVEIKLTEGSVSSFPYHFTIALYGIFTINKELSEETGEKLFRINAPALLYSAAREIIFNMTSHTKHQAFLLPSVSFIDEDITVKKEMVEETTKSNETTKAKKK